MPKFETDDQVRVRESSGMWKLRGQVGTVISSYGPDEVDVKFPGNQIRYTFGEGELELVLRDNSPKGEEVEVIDRESQWFGRRGTIKYRYPTGGMVDIDFGIGNVGTVHERYLQYTTPATEAKEPQSKYVVKSAGQKVFDSGAMRDAAPDKLRYDLIDPGFLLRLADHMRKGAEHYGEHNWTKGIPSTNYMQSILRHVEAYRRGERDEDHLSAAAFNLMGLMRNEGTKLDDLYDWTNVQAGS